MRVSDPAEQKAITMIILRIANRDKAALRELHDKMGDILFSILCALFDDHDLSKMTYMELMPKIWREAPDFEPALQDGASWVIARTRHLGIQRLRKLNPQRRLLAGGIEVETGGVQNLRNLDDAKDAAIILNRCIGHLPPLASDLVVASYIFGFSRAELADLYKKTADNINIMLNKAGQLLKICMRDLTHGT